MVTVVLSNKNKTNNSVDDTKTNGAVGDEGDGAAAAPALENYFENCHQFLCELIEMDARPIRGPYLGRIELHKEMTRNGCDAVALLGDIIELLVEYFRLFGDKPCCANDIVLFLDYIEPLRHAELASQLLQVCEISPTTLPSSVSVARRRR